MADGPTIVAKFIADTSKMTDEVDRAAGGAGGRLKDFAKGAAISIGGAFAVDKVLDFGTASVEAAMADAEAQEILAQTMRNVTGATDDQVAASEEFITNLSKQTAIADDDLRPAMGNLVRGFGDAEEAQKALAIATDISAATGKDMTTVSAALQKGAMGQTTALKKLGVETENADGSAKSMNDIMADLSKTFGGSATASADTAAGRMRNAQIQFGEFQESIGSAVLPVLAELGTMFTEKVIPALSSVASWIADNKDLIIAGLVGLAVVVGAVVIPAFVSWAIAAGAAAIATLTAIAPFILIGALIASIAFLIIRNWDNIVAGLGVVRDAIVNVVSSAISWIADNWPLLIGILFGPIGIVVALIITQWDLVKAAVATVWEWIQTVFGWIVDGIRSYVGAYMAIITGAWDAVKAGATAVWQWVTDKWNAISDAVHTAISNLLGWVTWGWDQIKAGASAVTDFVSGKWQAIADAFHSIVDKVANTARAIVDAIKGPINAVLSLWNNLAFAIPEIRLPEVDLGPLGKHGGGTFGGLRIDFPDVPLLAGGGVLTSATLFVGGEAGTEIVAPEDLLRTIVAEESGGGGTYVLNMYPRTADAADIAYGFRRLELLAGLP